MKTFQGLSVVFLFLLPLCITGQLTQQLIDALKRNPALISSLQNNPELLKSLLLQTQRQNQQQQQQIQQPKPSLPQALQQRRRLSPEPQQVDQCSTLRKQNKLLRQMIFSVTGSDPADLFPEFREQPRSFVDPTQAFLNQLQGVSQKVEPPKLSTSLKSVLITPSATWTTSEMTTSYITTVTHTETSKVPILLRGQRVVTTILEYDTQVVTATEIKTSSLLMTPEPTWSVETITITPTATKQPQILFNTASPSSNQQFQQFQPFRGGKSGSIFDPITQASPPKKRRTNTPLRAQVVEIDQKTSPSSRNDFKSAYGAFFASSAERSAKRFGEILRPTSPQIQNVNANPLLTSFDDFDYYDTTDFDQQLLAAQNAPVFVPPPLVKAQKSKVFTLYFSGTKPGQFTTKLTTLPVNANGQPVLGENRRKRETEEEEESEISPSKVEPIESTTAPQFDLYLDSSASTNAGDKIEQDSLVLDSSMTAFVTVTKTITQTVQLPNSACSQP